MALLKGKHNIAEIEGVRCSVIETGAGAARVAFLQDLLVHNHYEVKTEQEKAKDGSPLETFMVGVTDILCNPVIVLYEKKLVRPGGEVVTPAYWNQWPGQDTLPYWQVKR
jgi:hypothetical protein